MICAAMGKEFAYGYEKKPGKEMTELARKIMQGSVTGGAYRKSAGRPVTELTWGSYLKRRGKDKTTKRQSRAHTVKYSPFWIRIRG